MRRRKFADTEHQQLFDQDSVLRTNEIFITVAAKVWTNTCSFFVMMPLRNSMRYADVVEDHKLMGIMWESIADDHLRILSRWVFKRNSDRNV